MASPAPIVPTQTAATAPGNVPAPAEGDGAVSFEALLVAALAVPSGMNVDPLAAVCAPADGDKPEAKATDTTQTTDLPAQVLDIAAAAQVAVPAVPAAPISAGSSLVAGTDAPATAKGSLSYPAVAPALAAVHRDAVLPAARLPAAGLPVPDAASQDPASIAAATPGATRPATDSSPVSPPGLEPAPKPDSTQQTPSHDPNPAISVAPMASERVEGAARPSAQLARLEVAAPVGSREFGTEMGSRLVWMATNNHQVAELRLDPPQLGPVEVRLSIANDQASLSFASPHAAVRDAIQASLPRLQDMLQGLGITLGNVSVGADGFGQGNPDHSALRQGWSGADGPPPSPAYPLNLAASAGVLPLRAGLGVIDVYA
jgi:flagellar hook-length control protein FliK